MKIVFMGTPDFAVPSLERLIADGHEVLGVFTQPDKPKGRKLVLTPSPVKECALKHNISVFQPTSLKNGEAMPILNELRPDIIVVAAFGMLLKSDVLDFPRYGCINVHGSLLPKYRGAAPIQRAVIDGEPTSGVTIMQMGIGLDTGDMLLKRETEILPNETAGELFDRLSIIGADALSETLVLIEKGEITPEPQDDSKSSYAKMLSKNECPINWNDSAEIIHNKVRGMSPWPVATTMYNGEVIKVHGSLRTDKSAKNATPGTIFAEKNSFYVACGNGELLELIALQAPGAKRLATADFLRGHKLEGAFE